MKSDTRYRFKISLSKTSDNKWWETIVMCWWWWWWWRENNRNEVVVVVVVGKINMVVVVYSFTPRVSLARSFLHPFLPSAFFKG